MNCQPDLNQIALQFSQSNLLPLPHGMFDRQNGVSAPPYSSLNVSYGVGDKPDLVAKNRSRVKEALGITYLLSAEQVHGTDIFCSSDIQVDTEVKGYDSLITDQPGVGLMIQQADCQAILLYDPEKKVIAAVHNGWRGSALNIIGATVTEMQTRYQTNPIDLFVWISPSLGPCCAEFRNYLIELPIELHPFQEKPLHFNFWDISRYQLIEAGVRKKQIAVSHTCTSCNNNYFSYRRSKKKGNPVTGRNCSIISLPQQ